MNDEEFLKELERRSEICVNLDIDGFLCACLIKKIFPHYKITGYNNAKTNIWLNEGVDKNKLVYVDYIFNDSDVLTIDQHVNFNYSYNHSLLNWNPNSKFDITRNYYSEKFSYSLFFALLSLFEQNGYRVNLDYENLFSYISRADGVLKIYTIDKYQNVQPWKKELLKCCCERSVIYRIFRDFEKIDNIKDNKLSFILTYLDGIEKELGEKYSGFNKDGFEVMCDGVEKMLKDIADMFFIEDNSFITTDKLKNKILNRCFLKITDENIVDEIENDEYVFSCTYPYKDRMSVQINTYDKTKFYEKYKKYLCKEFDEYNIEENKIVKKTFI